MDSRLRIAFAGTPEFAVPTLHRLLDSRHSVVGVLTQPDRPKGRGRQVTASPVKQAAEARGVPVSQPQSLKVEADRQALVSWRPDVLVVVAYGLILPRPVLDLPRLGCVNIHASLLPRWRGAAPIQRAILSGDPRTGVCIMLMEAGLDTGPVLIERIEPILATDTAGSLHDRLAATGAVALLEALDGLSSGTLRARPQAAEGVTYASKIDKAEAVIDWTRGAVDIDRQIRAFNPWPIAETRLEGEQLRVFAAELVEETGAAAAGAALVPPGTICATHENGIVVQCGMGRLALKQVQRPGRKVVTAAEFAHSAALSGRRLG